MLDDSIMASFRLNIDEMAKMGKEYGISGKQINCLSLRMHQLLLELTI